MKKKLSIVAVLILAISLVVGVVVPGIAAADEAPPQENDIPPKVLEGKVTAIDESKSFFVIESEEGEEVTISVDDNTKYFKAPAPQKVVALFKHRMALRQQETRERQRLAQQGIMKQGYKGRPPWLKGMRISQPPKRTQIGRQELTTSSPTSGEGEEIPKNGRGRLQWLHRFGKKASFEDIAVGDKVAVRLLPGADTSVAELVIIIKPSAYQRINGTIDAITGDSITITNGSTVVLSYDQSTRVILKDALAMEPGQSAHVVYNSETMVAKLIMVPPKAVD